jgi:DNA-directed RNA polymerase subunit omega
LRDEYLKEAQKVITDANILINVVSRRVKQLKFGMKPLVESLEKLEPEDIALREVIEGKIDYELWDGIEEKDR